MANNNLVTILGTVYEVVEDAALDETFDGQCVEYSKEILIRPLEQMLGDDDSEDEKRKRYNEVLRHEIIHAFFAESGLEEYCNNEQLVDWIAKQFPKMYRVFAGCDCVK